MTPSGVPAVLLAIRILRALYERDGEPVGVSELAAILDANKSTCFNTLKTLQQEGFVRYDERTKTYRLGHALLALGLRVAQDFDAVRVALPYVRALVQEIEFAGLLNVRMDDERFIVVDKVESLKAIKVTIATGEVFPPNAPLLAKCYLAWQPEAVVEDFLARWGLSQFSPRSVTDVGRFREELAEVRRVGYAVSRGEYFLRNNALAAPVFDRNGEVALMISTLGFSSDLTDEQIPYYGGRLRAVAEQISAAIGGQFPVVPSANGDGRLPIGR